MKPRSFRSMLTKDQKRRIDSRHRAVVSGKLRPWLSPNRDEPFDEQKAFERLPDIIKSGHTKRLMKLMKEVYGS